MLVDFIVGVCVWTTQIISLSHSLLHFDAIIYSKCNVVGESGLELCVKSIEDEVHSCEHFHLHAPFSGNGGSWVHGVEHVGWSKNSNIREYFFDLLFAFPFGSQSHTLGIWIGTSG